LVSPRTIRKHWPDGLDCGPKKLSTLRWSAFVRNHAKAVIACDFATVVTAYFRRSYVLVIMEVGTRRILYFNVTGHPTAEWTAQQLWRVRRFTYDSLSRLLTASNPETGVISYFYDSNGNLLQKVIPRMVK
jgi:hypothetical protein